MLTQFSKKSVLLFVGAMAACAFVLPSAASAASWAVIGSHHTLDSPNFGYLSTLGGVPTTSLCTRSSFTARVASAQNLEITTGTIGGLCTTLSAVMGTCTMTTVGTRFPWTATAVTTSDIQIKGVHVAMIFENPPNQNTCSPFFNGSITTLTGNLTNGNWTGNSAHTFDFSNSEGLRWHFALGSNVPITTRGILIDTQNSLTVS